MFNFCGERALSSYKAGKFVFFMIFIAMFLLMFLLNDKIISSKDSNLLLRSSLSKDLSSHSLVNFFGLPTLGNFFTVLVWKKLFTHQKSSLIGQPTIDAIS